MFKSWEELILMSGISYNVYLLDYKKGSPCTLASSRGKGPGKGPTTRCMGTAGFLGLQKKMAKTSKSVIPLRCPHCAGPLSKEMETSRWNVPPLIRDSFSMIGSAVGGTTSAFYAFNYVMPNVRKWVKGPIWLHFLIGAPPVIVFSSACAGLAGGAVPALAQLASSSYHAAMLPSSHSSQDDETHTSRTSSTL